MSMTVERRRRKAPGARREEIVAAAGALALQEGLQSLTLRRVAEALGVVPGLVNHYFPMMDELAAAAFAHGAGAEREGIFGALAEEAPPLAQMRAVLSLLLGEEGDAISLLWLDAWQASRNRPALRHEVARQMAAWEARLARVIGLGLVHGVFRAADTEVAALRILALIDGLSVQAAIRPNHRYAVVRDLVREGIARELGVAQALLF